MLQLTSVSQFNQLKRGGQPFLVWFSAAWCGPCQRMDKKLLEEAAKEVDLPFYYCDYVVSEDVTNHCNVSRFPTFIIYRGLATVDTYSSADTIRVFQNIKKVGHTLK